MSKKRQPRSMVSFGPYSVNLQTGELYRGRRKIKLQEKAFQVLSLLLERPGEVITHQELRAQLVAEDSVMDFEHSLRVAVGKLRRALSDSVEKPRFIETVARHGYRFMATPEARQIPLTAPGRSERVLLAVLPFREAGNDAAERLLSNGLTQEIIVQLSNVSRKGIGVISRSSVMRYKGTDKSAAELGQELNAAYLVEGQVRRMGSGARIDVQLVRASDGLNIWSNSYEGDSSDILKTQREVAAVTVAEIKGKLLPHEPRRAC